MRQSRRLGIFVSGGIVPLTSSDYTYTGIANFIDEGDGNWQIKFLTSGTFTLKSRSKQLIDVFCVGGGGAGGCSSLVNYGSGGAGGGWTKTYTQMELKKGFSCSIVVGAGATAADGNGANGGQTYFNTTDYSANGGFGGKASTRSPFTTGDGGWGGSGGGSGAAGDKNGGAGGTDGSAGSYSGSGSGTNLATPVLGKDAQHALLLKHLALSTPMAGKAAAAMWEMAQVEALTLVTVAEVKVLTTPLLIPVGVAVLASL